MTLQSPLKPHQDTVPDHLCDIGAPPARRRQNFTPDDYRHMFGWMVNEVDGNAFLMLGHGMVGVVMPPTLAGAAVNLLRSQGFRGPVLEVSTGARVWIVLADPNGLVLCEPELPAGVKMLGCSAPVPLPCESGGSARWIIPPDVHHRWLPTLAAVLAAVPGRRKLDARGGQPTAPRRGRGKRHGGLGIRSGSLRHRTGHR